MDGTIDIHVPYTCTYIVHVCQDGRIIFLIFVEKKFRLTTHSVYNNSHYFDYFDLFLHDENTVHVHMYMCMYNTFEVLIKTKKNIDKCVRDGIICVRVRWRLNGVQQEMDEFVIPLIYKYNNYYTLLPWQH